MASSSAFILPYLSPKTLILSKSFAVSLSPFPFLKTQKPVSFPASHSLSLKPSSSSRTFSSSPFVRRVSVSSQYRQEEDEEVLEDEEVNFPPELKLFVGNLPFNVDSSELAGLFVQAGNVEKVEVIYDKLTGRSRGFGFVTMSTVEEVQAAEQQFNGYELDGRQLRVNSGPPPRRDDLSSRGFRSGGSSDGRGFRSGGSYDSANRVHVGNLSWGVDDLALESLFSEQGKVMEAKVVYDRESGRSRGFGFVTYSSAEEVDSAISSLDGVDLKGRQIRVTMAEARPPRRQF